MHRARALARLYNVSKIKVTIEHHNERNLGARESIALRVSAIAKMRERLNH